MLSVIRHPHAHDVSHRSKSLDVVGAKLHVAAEIPLGSVGLKATRVASGGAELYVSTSNQTKEWDACGPEAILRAAGGMMTDIVGEPLRYGKSSPETPHGMVASNGIVHAKAIEILRPLAKERGWVG